MSLATVSEAPWLKDATCASDPALHLLFFVDAGHSLSDEARAMCESCPVRKQCLSHSYEPVAYTAGYFGGLSPSQRKSMSLTQALAFIEDDSEEKKAA